MSIKTSVVSVIILASLTSSSVQAMCIHSKEKIKQTTSEFDVEAGRYLKKFVHSYADRKSMLEKNKISFQRSGEMTSFATVVSALGMYTSVILGGVNSCCVFSCWSTVACCLCCCASVQGDR